MTIKEYLDKRLTELEEGANTPLIEGKIMAFSEIYKRLEEFDHDVTLREVTYYCEDHMGEYGCDGKCRLYGYFCSARAGEQPRDWNLIELEKRVRKE